MNIRNLAAALAVAVSFAGAAAAQDKPLKVGVTAGPHAQIMEVVKKVAERDGLKVQIIEFNDYVQPNAALANGDLDLNSYQHQPYLDNTVRDRGYKIVSIAQTVTFPIGIYSKRVKSLEQIPVGGRVAIPNDPTNGGRVLLLLAEKGLVKLKPEAGLKATPLDVVDNPKKLKLIELDAAQLPRALDEVDAAAVNTNYAVTAGLVPTRDAIALENPRSPYANVIAARAQDKDRPEFKKFVKAYHSAEVKQFIEKEFKGSLIPAW